MHWVSPVFYKEAKFGPLEKDKKKTTDVNGDEIFQKNRRIHPL